MANFIDHLTDRTRDKTKEARLLGALHAERKLDPRLKEMMREHWHPLPARDNGERLPGFAIDGSSRRADLVNGSTLFVAQSLIIGEGAKEGRADIEILPGTVEAKTLDRFADLMRQALEIELAAEFAVERVPPNSIIYLDGALYGTLPQLYPLEIKDVPDAPDYATNLRRDYGRLFESCESRGIVLISIAKTNRQALFSRVLQARLHPPDKEQGEISDSALIHELTDHAAGFSTPLLLGEYGFRDQSNKVVLTDQKVKDLPAIVSFFIRFAAYDDALRIDVPASCIGRNDRIGDHSLARGAGYELLGATDVYDIIRVLMSDYGGVQVYNALAYVSDLEVRLTKQKMYDIYVPLVASVLGEELRIDRSQRRFVE